MPEPSRRLIPEHVLEFREDEFEQWCELAGKLAEEMPEEAADQKAWVMVIERRKRGTNRQTNTDQDNAGVFLGQGIPPGGSQR